MKGLWHSLAPFASDTNGACAVFAASPALVVAQDSVGSTSTLRRVIDPSASNALFETIDLPELLYTVGAEEEFLTRIERMFGELRENHTRMRRPAPNLLVLLNAPVSTLLGFDVRGHAARLSERIDVPVIGIETTGNRYYDKGIALAYEAIYGLADKPTSVQEGTVNLVGLTELDWPGTACVQQLKQGMMRDGLKVLCDFGRYDTLDRWAHLRDAQRNIVISASGLRIARLMEERDGIPFTTIDELDWFDAWTEGLHMGDCGKVLIIGEQVQSALLRRLLEHMGSADVTAATFFTCDKQLKRAGDVKLSAESDLRDLIARGNFSHVIGDAVFRPFSPEGFVTLMHPPAGFGARDATELGRPWLEHAVRAMGGTMESGTPTLGMRGFRL